MPNPFHCSWCGKFVNPFEAETIDYEGNVVYLCNECIYARRMEVQKMMEKAEKEVLNVN